MAPVRVHCKHVEVTEVALRIASFQTPQQSVASRPCYTNREWYTLYVRCKINFCYHYKKAYTRL